jgi:hypothetical protein
MIEVVTESKEMALADRYRLYAERLQLWGLCGNASCRRARGCRGDPLSCCRRFAEWADAVKDAAQHERDARDPAADSLRSELGRRLRRLAETMRDEPC